MPIGHEPSQDAQARAEGARARMQDSWMSLPDVQGVMVGALRDDSGAPTAEVGLVVLAVSGAVDTVAQQLPTEVDGTPVQVIAGSPGPESSSGRC